MARRAAGGRILHTVWKADLETGNYAETGKAASSRCVEDKERKAREQVCSRANIEDDRVSV